MLGLLHVSSLQDCARNSSGVESSSSSRSRHAVAAAGMQKAIAGGRWVVQVGGGGASQHPEQQRFEAVAWVPGSVAARMNSSVYPIQSLLRAFSSHMVALLRHRLAQTPADSRCCCCCCCCCCAYRRLDLKKCHKEIQTMEKAMPLDGK
jgi:hypothetical protein